MRIQNVHSRLWIFNSINKGQTGHANVIGPNLLPKFKNLKVIGLADYFFLVFIFSLRMRSNECMYLEEPWGPSTSRSKMPINNLSPGYEHKWTQMLCFCFFSCYLLHLQGSALFVTICSVLATPQNSLIKRLPDNDVASPAVRRACQPAGRIDLNKPKCMYMQRDRLLSEQQGSRGTDLLRFSGQH